MDNFSFYNPTRIIFGRDNVSRTGKEAIKLGKKALLVYGRNSVKANGVYEKITGSLKKNGVEWVEHPGVKPNPILSHVKEGIKKLRENGCDLLIAAGGGSVIDESKAIAAGAGYEGDVWDFFAGKARINSALPLLAVLTIPATGSEMNSGFVITNEETKQKYSSGSPFSFPKVSILDPETTYTLPKEQAAYGACDAAAHLLEGYLTAKDQDCEITDNYVFAVLKSVIASSSRIFREASDYGARASMMWSATLALNGLQSLGYGRVEFPNHAIEHSLSALYDIPHGLGLAIILPAYLKHHSGKAMGGRIEKMNSEVFGRKEKGAAPFENWLKGLGLKTRLSENGIPETDIEKIAENAMGLIGMWGMSVSKTEVLKILKLAR